MTSTLRTYPIELVQAILRIYNLISPVDALELDGMKLRFTLPRKERGEDLRVMTWLYEKLAKSLLSIQRKYLPSMSQTRYPIFHIDIHNDEETVSIEVSGILYIPPSSLLNLLNLFQWYEIRQQTGTKPKYTEMGRKLTSRLKNEIKKFKRKIDGTDFETVREETEEACHFCGDTTTLVNVWNYRIGNRLIEIHTPVCKKHRMRKI